MKIIGEKINGTGKSVAEAIAKRDADYIADLAEEQVKAGAALLDVNAGTTPDREAEDLVWLVGVVQDTVLTRLCLDSSRFEPLEAALKAVNHTPMINSISGESRRLEDILPLAARRGCEVIALALDENGIPKTVEERLAVIRRIMEKTRAAGLPDGNVYIDPLVMSIATDWTAGRIALEIIRCVRLEYPETHLTMGLSNVSFGLPNRSLVNRTFLSLAVSAGLDSAIIDPANREMRETLLATELVLGQDRFCRNYTQAYRSGKL